LKALAERYASALVDVQVDDQAGAWLVVTALLMVVAYLVQPVLGELLHRHFGG